MSERTFALIKPDAFEKRVVGRIVTRIEEEWFRIVCGQLVTASRFVWTEFYREHAGRPFFDDLCDFMASGPVFAMVLERENAIAHWRKVIGPTDPRKAFEQNGGKSTLVSSLRGLYGDLSGVVYRNCVHGSDSNEAAERETRLFWL